LQSKRPPLPSSSSIRRLWSREARNHQFAGRKREYTNKTRKVNIALVESSAPTANVAPLGGHLPCHTFGVLRIHGHDVSDPCELITHAAKRLERLASTWLDGRLALSGCRCHRGQRQAAPNVSAHIAGCSRGGAHRRRAAPRALFLDAVAGQEVGDRLPAHQLADASVLRCD
jgi:hypothetical protein